MERNVQVFFCFVERFLQTAKPFQFIKTAKSGNKNKNQYREAFVAILFDLELIRIVLDNTFL